MERPPKKPKMTRERYLELEKIRTEDPRHNEAIIQDYPNEWKDFLVAYRWYNYRAPIIIGGGYKGQ